MSFLTLSVLRLYAWRGVVYSGKSDGKALDTRLYGLFNAWTTLKKNGSVTLVGFSTFSVRKRAARTGRKPSTGDAIKIKAAKVPKFRPGKVLKDAVN